MKTRVIRLLENYPLREQKIALLHYEMQHTVRASPEEVIDAMSLGHGDSLIGNSSKNHISIAIHQITAHKSMNETSPGNRRW